MQNVSNRFHIKYEKACTEFVQQNDLRHLIPDVRGYHKTLFLLWDNSSKDGKRNYIFAGATFGGILLAHLWQYTGEQLISAENRHWIAGKDLLGSLVKS